MKTLDEVIDNFEKACDLERRCEGCSGCLSQEYGCPNDGAESVPDALEYLKEYRSKQETIAEQLAELEQKNDHVCELAKTVCEEYDRLCNRLAEEYRNDALSWDELKTMEGKPVWVELLKGKWKGWDVIGGFDEDDFGAAMVTICGDDYYKDDMGKTWQAYRKER